MNNRQRHLLRVLANTCVNNMTVRLTFLLALVIEVILLSLLGILKGNSFVVPEFAVSFLISTLVGLTLWKSTIIVLLSTEATHE